MKALKGIAIFLVVALLAIFMAVMFLPVDTFLAEKTASIHGYDVPDEYEDTLYRYYYNNLNKVEQLAYKIVYAAFLSSPEDGFPNQIVIPKLSDKELQEMYVALSYDNPDLYFLGNKCSMTSIGSVNYFVPQYIMTMDDYYKSLAKVSDTVHYILAGVPKSAVTEYDKELYIHDYIVQNCEYDESNSAMIYTMHGVLVDGKANCEGYSRTMQYLLRALGIYNYLAIGDAEGEAGVYDGHMWNIVKVDGNLYNVDVTWNDYSVSDSVDFPDNSVSHVFFNMSTEDIKKSHNVDDDSTWSGCKAESFGYFKNNGLYFHGYDANVERTMKNAVAESLSAGYNSVEFAFADKAAYDYALKLMVDGGSMYNIITSANSRVSNDRRVDAGSVQYALDENNLIMRFFFMK